MFLQSSDIRFKLIAGFSVTPIIMIFLNIAGIFQVNAIDRGLTNINEVNSVKQRYAINFRGSVHDRAISLRDVVLYQDSSRVKASLDEIDKLAEFYSKSAGPLDRIFAESKVSSEEISLLQEIRDIETATLPLARQVIEAKMAGNQDLAWKVLMEQAKPSFSEWLARINKFIDYQERLNHEESKAARSIASGFQQLMIMLTAACIATSGIFGFFIIRSVVSRLTRVAVDLDKSSQEVTQVSNVIAESSHNLAGGATHQASAIEAISTSLLKMNEVIEKNAEGSLRTLKLASESRDKASSGEEVVRQMVRAIEEIQSGNEDIKHQIEASNHQISGIIEVISGIGEKTKVINDIVFQTKLLSFNASVEAARAGENGKGFAVVAEEIGKLAQISGNAAHQISEMLNSSREKVQQIVSDTQSRVTTLVGTSREKVEAGSRVASMCTQAFNEIVTKVNDVTAMAEQISIATKEQSVGFNNITKKIGDMDEVTQQNAALATETAKALEALKTQAVEMRRSFVGLSQLINHKNQSFENFSEESRDKQVA